MFLFPQLYYGQRISDFEKIDIFGVIADFWPCVQGPYNYFLFCHPEMFKAVYLYEKILLWHTIWVVHALGPKVHKKKFW